MTEKIIGLDPLMKHIPKAVKDKVISKLMGVFTGGGAEALQEVTEGIMHNVVEKFTTNEQAEIFGGDLSREAIVAGSVGAITEAIILGITPGKSHGNISKSALEQRALENVIDLSKESKTNGRSKEKFTTFMQSIGDQEVFIPEEYLKDVEVPDYVKEQIDGLGGDVVMPLDVFLTDFVEYEEAMSHAAPHMRMSEDGLSSTEIEESKTALTEVIKEHKKLQKDDKAIAKFTDKIEEQLVATKRMGVREAKLNASVMSDYIETKSEMDNIPVSKIVEDMGLVVEKGSAEEAYNQLIKPEELGKIEKQEIVDGRKAKVKRNLDMEYDKIEKRQNVIKKVMDCL